MEYSIEIYFGTEKDSQQAVHLGSDGLQDKITFDYYERLMSNNVKFTVRFNSKVDGKPYGFLDFDSTSFYTKQEETDKSCLKVLVTQVKKLRLLSHEEWSKLTIQEEEISKLPLERWKEIINYTKSN
jgi:hypothetical protein